MQIMETQLYTKKIKMNLIQHLLSFIQKKKVISIIILVVIAGSAYGIYEKFFNLSDAERAQKELTTAIAAVSKHMVLPEGDEPVLATVTDAETLATQQAFFAGVANGDQLLLFPRNVKAILYSPSRDKIVNVGPIQQDQVAAVGTSKATSTASKKPVENVVTNEDEDNQ